MILGAQPTEITLSARSSASERDVRALRLNPSRSPCAACWSTGHRRRIRPRRWRARGRSESCQSPMRGIMETLGSEAGHTAPPKAIQMPLPSDPWSPNESSNLLRATMARAMSRPKAIQPKRAESKREMKVTCQSERLQPQCESIVSLKTAIAGEIMTYNSKDPASEEPGAERPDQAQPCQTSSDGIHHQRRG